MEQFASCLEKLDVLRSMGHMTDEEYDSRRQKLVDDFVGQPTGAPKQPKVTLAPASRVARRVALPPSVAAALARARGAAAAPSYAYAAAMRAPAAHMGMAGIPRGPYTKIGGYSPYPAPEARGPYAAVKVVPVPDGVELDEVIAAFQPFGTVTSAVVKQGPPRLAYVNYATEAEARSALHAHVVLLGQLCTLTLSRRQKPPVAEGEPTDGIGIFNLPFTMSQDDIHAMLMNYPGFQTLRFITTKLGQFRGYVFAYFDCVENAMGAKEQLLGSTLQGQVLDVKYSNRRKEDVGVP